MKFTLLSSLFFGALAVVSAEDGMHYFSSPRPNTILRAADAMVFTTNDITNDENEAIIARLYNAEDDEFVKEIGTYTGATIVRPDDTDDFTFYWQIDVPPGTYFVRLFEQDADGGLDDDDEEDNQIRSHDFVVRDVLPLKKRSLLNRRRLLKAIQ
ncbi:hypothetical protein EDC96DRAFT_479869 [Choanephora cucurbitarum]|nr:hypothetical protein EDC96DRAFT_479869 [Choanephora cucurbitarum]